jgi:hypothetical protein
MKKIFRVGTGLKLTGYFGETKYLLKEENNASTIGYKYKRI